MGTKMVHFTVTGEYLTRTARDILLSDEPGKAYRLIANSLIGDGGDEASVGVLRGTHDLDGDSSGGIGLVKAEDTEELRKFLKDIAYIYAGRHRRDGSWWRPVAWVTNFDKNDAEYAGERFSIVNWEDVGKESPYSRARTEYYCVPGETVGEEVIQIPSGEKTWVIWEACGEAPHWMNENVTEQGAFDEHMRERGILTRGADTVGYVEPINDSNTVYNYSRARPWPTDDKGIKLREAEEAELSRRFDEEISRIGEEVRAQAGGDTFVLELKSGREINVPRAPFINWASRRTHTEFDSLPEWEVISSSGMKLPNDDPYHTDWVLGSGLTLEESYKDEVNGPAWEAAFRIQDGERALQRGSRKKNTKPAIEEDAPLSGFMAAMKMLQDTVHPAAVMVNAGERTGVVGVDIAVFPDSKAERAMQLKGISGAIVEKGGRLAHFAIVTKGLGVTVMCHPNACEVFTPGTKVMLNPNTGRIVIVDDDESEEE